MAARMHRTQILLEPEQHQALGQIAQKEGRSVSNVVRKIVQHALEQHEEERQATIARRMEAMERIRQHREEILARRGGKPLDFDAVEEINQARDERDAHNRAILLGNSD